MTFLMQIKKTTFSPKRSITVTYSENFEPVILLLQSMSAWYVFYTVGVNSRRYIQITPEKGYLEPNQQIQIKVVAKCKLTIVVT